MDEEQDPTREGEPQETQRRPATSNADAPQGKLSKKLMGVVVAAIGITMGLGLMISNMGGDGNGEAQEDRESDRRTAAPPGDSGDFLDELREREQEALERRRAREEELREEGEEEPEVEVEGEPDIAAQPSDPEQTVDPEVEREREIRKRVAQSDMIAIDNSSMGVGGVGGAPSSRQGAEGAPAVPGAGGPGADPGVDPVARAQESLQERLGNLGNMMGPGGGLMEETPSRAERNEEWLRSRSESETNRADAETEVRDRPHERPVVYEGSVIPAVLQTDVNSDLPGMVTAMVTRDVRDSVTGGEIVIPRGSRVVGEYNADVLDGQDRLVFAFERIIYPDGRDVDISAMGGADESGASGVEGNVNTHFWSRLGRAGLIGAITLGAERQAETSDSVIGGDANQTGTAASEIFADVAEDSLDRHRDRGPTITIPAGEPFTIMVNQDIVR
ncbi:TrbI/VirB10 family protein [Thioalkalivibrio sp. ALE23]|uniref:TrbI/VirB10 family protein n=1 Tax=Thioalkalivibrio sp. ALE23 TaxID=1265495 RepID=UPI0003A33B43|nr:TrbI/VirB10 family protein [Thioalkalivibrio sp. ALE23]